MCVGGLCIERLYIMMPRVLSEREARRQRRIERERNRRGPV